VTTDMPDRGRLLAVAFALAVAALVCGAAVAGALTVSDAGAQDRTTPETGQQVATVIAVTDEEVRRDVGASAIEAAAQRGDEDALAAALAERAATLAERGDRIASEFETATAAYENGTLSEGEYAWRLALLHARAGTVSDGIDHAERRAADVPQAALDDAGYDAADLAEARDTIDPLTGRGFAALLAQYTGEASGSFDVETEGGLSLEVETDDDEYSREFERERSGDGGPVEIDALTALAAAHDALSGADGAWYPTELELDRDDGVYDIAFVYWSGTHVGEAEVAVDGATGEVFSLEADREPHDGSASRLGIDVRDGSLEPGGTVTLAVAFDGEPAAGATIFLDGEVVGDTDDAGAVTVSLPRGDDIEITVEYRDAEAELELGFDPPEDEADDPPEDQDREDDDNEGGNDDDDREEDGEDDDGDEEDDETEGDEDDDDQDDELPEEPEDEEETEQENDESEQESEEETEQENEEENDQEDDDENDQEDDDENDQEDDDENDQEDESE